MAVQIANPEVVRKIESLAVALNTSKTGAVEQALDAMISNLSSSIEVPSDVSAKTQRREDMLTVLSRIHATPVKANAVDPMEWDENGLPV